MTGPGDPPEGIPEGSPGSGDDEYRSVVFDESFVRAARIQEYSARERLDGSTRAVRTRRFWARGGATRQALVLVVLIAVAFGTAIYLGIRNPYEQAPEPVAQPLRITLVPLAPAGAVPAADRARPFAGSAAAGYRTGSEGFTLPAPFSTPHFGESQVTQALTLAKEYLWASAVDPAALTGGEVRTVREMLDPGQRVQFDRSLTAPADDGRHAATGWLVRLDPARIALADEQVRVAGTMAVMETADDALEVLTDHTMVYAVRAAVGNGEPSLFTVRRALRIRFDRQDLRDQHVELLQADVEAGPLSCGSGPAERFEPLLAGEKAAAQAGVDPYDHRHQITSVCGALAPGSLAGPGVTARQGSPAARPSESSAAPGSPVPLRR
ncbi:hypothetical protein [Streptomyces sp. MI02-7b]|uniref:SCO2583 family membrane protein n=1 Tax=Streptomyces sp. MI02-7b TaxID=462941 RepID=UPI0029A9F226|nr:hypothetical protein [Streptomyces sp. MI02-7b]